jgi:adenylate cyclase
MKGNDSPNIREFAGVFSRFRIYVNDRRLYRLDQAIGEVPIRLGNATFCLLHELLNQKGKSVSKKSLIDKAWEGKVKVDRDDNLRVEINKLRTSLGEDAHNSCIQTSSGGYAYIQPENPPNAFAELPRPRLSIVVLPFANLSEDRGQQYFADGVTDDLTTDLSRIDGMFVISRNSAFTYRDKPVNTKQIGRELGVRYVLEGSVNRSGDRVRVNAQLIDADSDGHLWAERFDHDIGDLFTLQNEVTSQIAVALNLELVNAEAARPAEDPSSLDYILRGRAAAWGNLPSPKNCAEAIGLFERALTLEPGSVGAQSWLASVLANRLLDFPAYASEGDIGRAEELATKAVAASPRVAPPHFARGQVLRVQKRYEEAIAEFETVLSLNRNWVGAIFALGWCKFHTGLIDETIPLFAQLLRLSPRDPYIGIWYGRIGIAHLLQWRLDDAIVWLEKARTAVPSRPWTRSSLAVAYAHKGEMALAAAEIAEAQRLSADGRYLSIARLKKVGYLGVPKVRELFETIYLDGYRKAGVPEE